MKKRCLFLALVVSSSLAGCGSLPVAETSEATPIFNIQTEIPASWETLVENPTDSITSSAPVTTEFPTLAGDYRIGIDSTNWRYDIELPGDFNIWFPSVAMFNNEELAEKINKSIIEASTSWASERVLSLNGLEGWYPIIYFHSDRYLSYECTYYYTPHGGNDGFDHDVTIDVQTGKRVMLDDLIDVNDAFIDLLHKGSIVYGISVYENSYAENAGYISEHVKSTTSDKVRKMSRDELVEFLMGCSIDISEYSQDSDLGRFIYNYSFHVESGRLFIEKKRKLLILLYLDDIEEFLKVPKW